MDEVFYVNTVSADGILQVSARNLHSDNQMFVLNIDGLVQERRNSCALAMELCLLCINPPIYTDL